MERDPYRGGKYADLSDFAAGDSYTGHAINASWNHAREEAQTMIGKTRQQLVGPSVVEVFDPGAGAARGMLLRPFTAGSRSHARRSPSPALANRVAHYWMMSWDLRACEPYLAESLPHPNVHVAFEESGTTVLGVHTRKMQRLLEGAAQAFGVKFQPGAFRLCMDSPVSVLANRVVPAETIFGNQIKDLRHVVISDVEENAKVQAANAFFESYMPPVDDATIQASQLVRQILEDRKIKNVDDLVQRSGIAKRSLQRIFKEYVGAAPKWVIQRYRLHELIERFKANDELHWAQVASELGYFDQAHLIKDFKAAVGYTPTEYSTILQGRDITQ